MDWRGIFWFNLVFGLAALVVAAVILPESADPTAARGTREDPAGCRGAAAFVFAIIDSEFGRLRRGRGDQPAVRERGTGGGVCLAGATRSYPLLDLRFLRAPQFTTANIAAFCSYFSTFAIFFFTALYLAEVAGASGYRLAPVFLPMTMLMIASSLLAGRWTVRPGRAGRSRSGACCSPPGCS